MLHSFLHINFDTIGFFTFFYYEPGVSSETFTRVKSLYQNEPQVVHKLVRGYFYPNVRRSEM